MAQKNREDIIGSWIVISGNNKIAKRWSIPTVGILRHYKLFNAYEFSFARIGLTYKAKDNLFLTTGIAYLDAETYAIGSQKKRSTQLWLYQENVFNIKLKKLRISNRLRFENRWINKKDNDITNYRLRYRLQLKYPINKYFYLKTFNEFFYSFNTSNFNQNRFYAGLGCNISNSIKLETGYIKNSFPKAKYDRLRIVLLFKTNLIKKKTILSQNKILQSKK
ncbi:DUF2490 domain-containing protein [Flavivirga aquatica]|uniref:DUF2490 domain-containing protein n=1 Tax=Flavivirga aquatica TaxID=1849968 RepID=UPI0013F4F440|nr:DUF2490 domain-containing protein [Flavivirga aquatica]